MAQLRFRLTHALATTIATTITTPPYPYTCGHMHYGRHHQRFGSPYALHTRLDRSSYRSQLLHRLGGLTPAHLTFYPTGFGVACAVLAIHLWSWPTGGKWL